MKQRTVQRVLAPLRQQALKAPSSPLARSTPIIPRHNQSRQASSTAKTDLKKTPLYDFQNANGANLVPFAGHYLPAGYAGQSHTQSHTFTREHASLFDVSHMAQHILKGPAAADFLETVTPSSFKNQGPMQAKLTTFLWSGTGGIVDDGIVTRLGEDEYHIVTNGACLEKDTKFIEDELARFGGGSVEWVRPRDSGLIALQGPQSAEILAELLEPGVDLRGLYFGNAARVKLRIGNNDKLYPVLVSRGGYTGEDGFELSFSEIVGSDPEVTPLAADALLGKAGPGRLQLAGLGARDSLRLEAGMCLYGNEVDDTTTPVEASLSWIIPKERRETGGFNGAEVILAQLKPKSKGGLGVARRRVGLLIDGAPARGGAEIAKDGEVIGTVTSGSPSPTLGRNIAMGYVRDGLHKVGTELDVLVRGKKRKGTVTKMPFVPARYWKGCD